jgi:hypothetical protein
MNRSSQPSPWGSRLQAAARRSYERARQREEGQALVLCLIIVLLLVLIVPIVVAQVNFEGNIVAQDTNFEAALAAADAGVQQYRNFLDVESNYWQYNASTCTKSPVSAGGDVALCTNGWKKIRSSSPPEAFHYIPNITTLPGTDTVILTVTGRAGNPGHYVYRTVQTDLEAQGILSNAYFSQYETEDWQQDIAQVSVVPWQTKSGVTTHGSATVYPVAQAPAMVSGQTFWQSLCQYESYQPNTFVDSLTGGNAIGPSYIGGNYSSSGPYYGAFRGNQPNSTSNNNTFTYTYPSQTNNGVTTWQVATVTDPCGSIFNFVGGENFTGPVYSNDQFWVCGNPTFSGGLTSGVPKGFKYAYSAWPTQDSSEPSGTNGWIDNLELNWDGSCSGGGKSSPNFGGGVATPGGDSNLPPENGLLQTQAAASGCVYTGPTMIQFIGTSMDVWSPLTTSPGTGCGTFSTSAPYQSGVPFPSSGLIYVQNAPSTTTIPATSTYSATSATATGFALPYKATCLDPWKPYVPVSGNTPCPQAYDGDVIVSGELQGQVTLAAADNVIMSRDISYNCADGSGVSAQDSGTYVLSKSGSTCVTESTPDVLGLVANAEIVTEKPGVTMNASSLPPTGTTDDVTTGSNGYQTEPYEWPAITTSSSSIGQCDETNQDQYGDQTPTSQAQFYNFNVPDCDMENQTVDAALVALLGSFADEDWDMADCTPTLGSCQDNGGAYVQGTDVSYYRGPFGFEGQSGMSKEFTYDTRLRYLTPPDLLEITDLIWASESFVDCGSADDESWTTSSTFNVCPGLSWLNS